MWEEVAEESISRKKEAPKAMCQNSTEEIMRRDKRRLRGGIKGD